MRIGILGGSFDPVHVGHLWIAEAATEQLQLDQLRWLPAATQPLKPKGPVASDADRVAMLRLAIAGREGQWIDERELRRAGVSYTVDTVDQLRAEQPQAAWCLIIGSDSLHSMPQWHQPGRLLDAVDLAVVQRGGEEEIDFSVLEGLASPERVARFRDRVVRMPAIELSSSEIRDRVRAGRSIRHLVPRAVEAYIAANGLYRESS
jgi:nicotinate-nucleotide adenylyltransferase